MEKVAHTNALAIPDEVIMSKIYFVREQKVMIDSDLSELYGVETRRLNEQVKRNISRFPGDFMFQLSGGEFKNLKSQIATSRWGGRRKPPYVFTEHGVLMLSSVLNSERATLFISKQIHVFSWRHPGRSGWHVPPDWLRGWRRRPQISFRHWWQNRLL